MMATRTYFMTAVSHSLVWAFAIPKRSMDEANYAAENAVTARLLKDLGIESPKKHYGAWVRAKHPELILEAQQYIGDTREVEIPDRMTPKEYRRWYCRGDRGDGWDHGDTGVWA